MTIPYTYFIKHIETGRKYYGVRYSKNCHPKEFFIKYFTSSKIIKHIIQQQGINAFEFRIHKIFSSVEDACLFEQKFLKRVKAHQKHDWFNQSIPGDDPVLYSKGCVPWNKGLKNSPTTGKSFYNNGEIQKMLFENEVPEGWKKGRLNSPWNKNLTCSDERVKRNLDLARKTRLDKGYPTPWNKGLTKETDERIKKYAKDGSNIVQCPYCDKKGALNPMRRHHFDNCKMKGQLDEIKKKKKKVG